MARILIISVVHEPDTVSTAGIVGGLARGLRDLGHDVSVLSSVPHYNPPTDPDVLRRCRTGFLRPYRYQVEDGVAVARCYVPRKRGPVPLRLFDFAVLHLTMALAALRFFRRSEVAIVVSPPFTMTAIALVLSVISGTRVIYNAQELWPDAPRDLGVVTNPTLLRFLAWIERRIYRTSDAVTPIGERFGEIIRQRGGDAETTVVIPNFVDTTWITPQPKSNPLSKEWGVDARPVALYAGNIGLTQDFPLVLDAAEKLPEMDFVIVGSGAAVEPLRRMLAARRPSNVQLHPYVPSERVADLYGLADVVLVPLREGHDRTTTPSKIFSAMAAGKPVLATASADTDLADTISTTRSGVVVSPGDVGAFVDALAQLLAGDAAGSWNRDTALVSAEAHTPGAIASRYDSLITRVTEQRS